MNWSQILQQLVKKMRGKVLTADDMAVVVKQVESDLEAASATRDNLKAEFDAHYIELHAASDEVAIRRHRNAIRAADANIAELRESLDRVSQALHQAQHREARARLAVAWRATAEEGAQLDAAARELDQLLQQLASRLLAHADKWAEFHEHLPQQPARHQVSRPFWEKGHIARAIELRLFALSKGMVCRKNGLSVWEAQKLPAFEFHAREALEQALQCRPNDLEVAPPPEAA